MPNRDPGNREVGTDTDHDRAEDRDRARQDASERQADTQDEFDRDLQNDNARRTRGGTDALLNPDSDVTPAPYLGNATGRGSDLENRAQYARKGQAESPREDTLNQPEHRKEGHGTRHRDGQ